MDNTKEGLFREKAVANQAARLDGDVAIYQPVPSKVLFGALLLVVFIAIVFLCSASFHRKETVIGFISPDNGLSKVLSPTTGVLQKLIVSTGDRITKGQPIALIKIPQHTASGQSVTTEMAQATATQINLIEARMQKATAAFDKELETIKESISYNMNSLAQTRLQIEHASERLRIQSNRYTALVTVFDDGAIARNDVEAQQEQVILHKQQVAELHSREQQQANEVARLERRLELLPSQHAQNMAVLESEIAGLTQQLTRTQANSEWLVTAPASGTITNVALSQGTSVRNQQYLLTIMPDNSNLKATLLVPSRAYGFVKTGQSTKLRFDAFPYQRFGIFDGVVTNTSRYIVLPGEMEMPIAVETPVYRVEVAMAAQQIRAYGQSVPLQPGMTISADIVLEERSLLSWLFEPIISLKGRV